MLSSRSLIGTRFAAPLDEKRRAMLGLVVLLLFTLTHSSVGAATGDLTGVDTPNGKAIYEWADLLWNQRKVEQAYEKYFGSNFIVHSFASAANQGRDAQTASGRQAARGDLKSEIHARKRFLEQHPQLQTKISKILVSGELVFVAVVWRDPAATRWQGDVLMLRLENGRAIEQWNLNRWMPWEPDLLEGAKTPNGRIVVAMTDMLANQHRVADAYQTYVAEDFKRHYFEPLQQRAVEPGGVAADLALSDRENLIRNDAAVIEKHPELRMGVRKVLVFGEFVFLHVVRSDTSIPTGRRDELFLQKVRNGKITDEWILRRLIPDDLLAPADTSVPAAAQVQL
jgi:predicted SnoaL-like aldol condensation-catalyzing enzyme